MGGSHPHRRRRRGGAGAWCFPFPQRDRLRLGSPPEPTGARGDRWPVTAAGAVGARRRCATPFRRARTGHRVAGAPLAQEHAVRAARRARLAGGLDSRQWTERRSSCTAQELVLRTLAGGRGRAPPSPVDLRRSVTPVTLESRRCPNTLPPACTSRKRASAPRASRASAPAPPASWARPATAPPTGSPELVTSFAEFERVFGGLDRLEYVDETERAHNYLAHGVRNFFDNGGKPPLRVAHLRLPAEEAPHQRRPGAGHSGGRATDHRRPDGDGARFPGRAGDAASRFDASAWAATCWPPTATVSGATFNVLRGVNPGDVVWVADAGSPRGSRPAGGTLFRAERYFDGVLGRSNWRLTGAGAARGTCSRWTWATPARRPVHVVSVTLEVTYVDRMGRTCCGETCENLGFSRGRRGLAAATFGADLPNRAQSLRTPVIFDSGAAGRGRSWPGCCSAVGARPRGDLPAASGQGLRAYAGGGQDGLAAHRGGLHGSEDPNDAAPRRASSRWKTSPTSPSWPRPATRRAATPTRRPAARADHLQRAHQPRGAMRYRIAVLDSADGQSLADVRAQRSQLDTATRRSTTPG